MIFHCVSSAVILSFSFSFFHSSFIQCYPLGSSYLVGKVLKYRYIEFFAFDYDSLPISGIAVFLWQLLIKFTTEHAWARTHDPDTPVSHSIDIPTEELKILRSLEPHSFLPQYPLRLASTSTKQPTSHAHT